MPRKQAKERKEYDAKYDAKRAGQRTRNWTFLVYPESAPENWRNIINAEHVPWVESPLHEGEMNPDSEGEKKPHYHVILLFDNIKHFEQVKELSSRINSPIPQKAASMRYLVRYLAHLDHPDKKQYNANDIICHGGAEIRKHLQPPTSARYEMIAEMRQWVCDNQCIEFDWLFDYSALERCDDWFPLLCDSSAYIMQLYIKSRRHTFFAEKEERRKNTDSVELARKEYANGETISVNDIDWD